jgi:hypothetical protein
MVQFLLTVMIAIPPHHTPIHNDKPHIPNLFQNLDNIDLV